MGCVSFISGKVTPQKGNRINQLPLYFHSQGQPSAQRPLQGTSTLWGIFLRHEEFMEKTLPTLLIGRTLLVRCSQCKCFFRFASAAGIPIPERLTIRVLCHELKREGKTIPFSNRLLLILERRCPRVEQRGAKILFRTKSPTY